MRWIVAVVLLWVAGCANLFMEPPPRRWSPPQELDCTATSGFVSWDILNVVGHLVSAGLLANLGRETGEDSFYAYALINGAFAVGHIASAENGSDWVKRCRRFRERRDRWIAEELARTKSPDAAPPDAGPADGTLGGTCYGNGTCDEGLTCDTAINRCTMRVGSEPDAGVPADAGTDASP